MRKVVGVGFAVMLAASSLWAQPVTFSHEPVECVSAACGRAAVNAKVESSVPLRSVRVYFNNGSGPEYYVEMLHGGDWNFKAILPAVTAETTSISYRIVAIDEDGSAYDGPSVNVPVTADCAPTPLTEEQTSIAMNTAIGLTDSSQSGAPEGFSCTGLVKVISPDEVMSNNDACEEVKLAKTDSCLMGVAGEGATEVTEAASEDSRRKVIAYTAAGLAVGAGGAIIYYENKDEPVSKARP